MRAMKKRIKVMGYREKEGGQKGVCNIKSESSITDEENENFKKLGV